MSPQNIKEKVIQGTSLAVRRMIERKKKEGGYVLVPKNGKLVKVPAKDIKLPE